MIPNAATEFFNIFTCYVKSLPYSVAYVYQEGGHWRKWILSVVILIAITLNLSVDKTLQRYMLFFILLVVVSANATIIVDFIERVLKEVQGK